MDNNSNSVAKAKNSFLKSIYILYTLAHLKQKANVRGTFLGYLWWFIEPALLIALYSYVVGVIFRHSGPERILLIAIGVTLWKWWHSSLSTATTSFRRYKGIVTQVKMPLPILPISDVFGQTYLFLFGYAVLGLVLLCMGHPPNLMALILSFTTSVLVVSTLALALAILNVFVRDTAFLVGFGLRILFYITPILYSPERVPERYHWMLTINPFAHLINFYDEALIYTDTVVLIKNFFAMMISLVILIGLIDLCKRLTPYIVRNV